MKNNNYKPHACTFVATASLLLVSITAQASTPVWTFSAPTPATTTLDSGSSATVLYTVTNQSNKPKQLRLKPMAGVSASPCNLSGRGSQCTLVLQIDGASVPVAGIHAGPVLCEQGNVSQCYQPAAANVLNVRASAVQYQVSATGDNNITSINPPSQPVSANARAQFEVSAAQDFAVDTANVGGNCPAGGSFSGSTYTSAPITGTCNLVFNSHLLTANINVTSPITTSTTPVTLTYEKTGTPVPDSTQVVVSVLNTGPDAATNVQASLSGIPALRV